MKRYGLTPAAGEGFAWRERVAPGESGRGMPLAADASLPVRVDTPAFSPGSSTCHASVRRTTETPLGASTSVNRVERRGLALHLKKELAWPSQQALVLQNLLSDLTRSGAVCAGPLDVGGKGIAVSCVLHIANEPAKARV